MENKFSYKEVIVNHQGTNIKKFRLIMLEKNNELACAYGYNKQGELSNLYVYYPGTVYGQNHGKKIMHKVPCNKELSLSVFNDHYKDSALCKLATSYKLKQTELSNLKLQLKTVEKKFKEQVEMQETKQKNEAVRLANAALDAPSYEFKYMDTITYVKENKEVQNMIKDKLENLVTKNPNIFILSKHNSQNYTTFSLFDNTFIFKVSRIEKVIDKVSYFDYKVVVNIDYQGIIKSDIFNYSVDKWLIERYGSISELSTIEFTSNNKSDAEILLMHFDKYLADNIDIYRDKIENLKKDSEGKIKTNNEDVKDLTPEKARLIKKTFATFWIDAKQNNLVNGIEVEVNNITVNGKNVVVFNEKEGYVKLTKVDVKNGKLHIHNNLVDEHNFTLEAAELYKEDRIVDKHLLQDKKYSNFNSSSSSSSKKNTNKKKYS